MKTVQVWSDVLDCYIDFLRCRSEEQAKRILEDLKRGGRVCRLK